MLAFAALDEVHLQAAGDAIEDRRIHRLNEGDDVGVLRQQNFGKRIGAPLSAVQNVVADDPHIQTLATPEYGFELRFVA